MVCPVSAVKHEEKHLKKILSFLLATIAVMALAVPVCGAEAGIVMVDATLQEAGTVYVPVSLETEITADALALEYTYDSQVLEILPGECRWIPKGVLTDFSKTGPQAVWAASGAKTLSGDLCVLAFRIVDTGSFGETQVSCGITAKNGSETLGLYQDSAKITRVCVHRFGEWTTGGAPGHVRQCTLCKREELQSHNWDGGTESTDPERPYVSLITYRCADCAEEKVVEIPGGTQEIRPTYPEATRPSEFPEQYPEETRPQPSYPPERDHSREDPEQEAEPDNPSSQGSGKPGGSSDDSGRDQLGNTGPQPQDYNQLPKDNTQNPTQKADGTIQPGSSIPVTKGDAAQTAGNPDAAGETHPMTVKVENPTGKEDPAAEQTAGAAETARSGGIVAGILLAVCAAGVLGFLVIRKKKR